MIFLKLVGWIIIAMGFVVLSSPHIVKSMMAFWKKGANVFLAALVRVILGSLFLYCASFARVPQLMLTLGVLVLASGLFIFVLGLDRSKRLLEKVEQKPPVFLRLLSLVIFLFGALIIIAA